MITRMIVIVVVFFGVLLLLLPRPDDSAKMRMASAAMLVCSGEFREIVAGQFMKNEAIGLTFVNNCPNLINTMDVDETGIITLRGAQHGIVIVMQPVIDEGKVRWRCRGEPVEAITKLCKP